MDKYINLWGRSPPHFDIFVQIWLFFDYVLICSCNFDFILIMFWFVFEYICQGHSNLIIFLICSLIFLWFFREPLILEKLAGIEVSRSRIFAPLIFAPCSLGPWTFGAQILGTWILGLGILGLGFLGLGVLGLGFLGLGF